MEWNFLSRFLLFTRKTRPVQTNLVTKRISRICRLPSWYTSWLCDKNKACNSRTPPGACLLRHCTTYVNLLPRVRICPLRWISKLKPFFFRRSVLKSDWSADLAWLDSPGSLSWMALIQVVTMSVCQMVNALCTQSQASRTSSFIPFIALIA